MLLPCLADYLVLFFLAKALNSNEYFMSCKKQDNAQSADHYHKTQFKK